MRSIGLDGTMSISEVRGALKESVHVIVGTPGRVQDLMQKRLLNTTGLRVLILD